MAALLSSTRRCEQERRTAGAPHCRSTTVCTAERLLPPLTQQAPQRAALLHLEAAHLSSLHRAGHCELPRERYDRADLSRNSQHKRLANRAFSLAVSASGLDGGVLILDSSEGNTSRALLDAGVPAWRILVPNPHPHVVSRLRELGVAAFCATVEAFLDAAVPPLAAAYLDHTSSLRASLLAQLRQLARTCQPGAVLAATFSCRSPVAGAPWSRAHALHACIDALAAEAAARGLSLAGGAAWAAAEPGLLLADYSLAPRPAAAGLAAGLAASDLSAIAAALADWAESPGEAPGRLRASAAAVSAAAGALAGGVAGAAWLPGAAAPLAVLCAGPPPVALDDAAARALLRVAKAVLAFSAPAEHARWARAGGEEEGDGAAEPAGLAAGEQTSAVGRLRGTVHLYDGQMALVICKLA